MLAWRSMADSMRPPVSHSRGRLGASSEASTTVRPPARKSISPTCSAAWRMRG